jgi:hypothetical protein
MNVDGWTDVIDETTPSLGVSPFLLLSGWRLGSFRDWCRRFCWSFLRVLQVLNFTAIEQSVYRDLIYITRDDDDHCDDGRTAEL